MGRLLALVAFVYATSFVLPIASAHARFWLTSFSDLVECYDYRAPISRHGVFYCTFRKDTIQISQEGVEYAANLGLTTSRRIEITQVVAYARFGLTSTRDVCVHGANCTVYLCMADATCVELDTTSPDAYVYTNEFDGVWRSDEERRFSLYFQPHGSATFSPVASNDQDDIAIEIHYTQRL